MADEEGCNEEQKVRAIIHIPEALYWESGVAYQLAKKQLGGLLGAYLGAYLGAFPE